MATPRAAHSATLLPNGDILVAGGGQLDIDDLLVSFPVSEVFHPSNGTFTTTGALSVPREFHTATLLQSGKVLITGGNGFYGYPTWLQPVANAELYDPSSGTFVTTENMSVPRTGHTASLLPDGRVLIFGGTADDTPSAEIYDPATGTFALTPSPQCSRTGHTATVLPSGKVLIVGGRNLSGALATAEMFDPGSGTFSPVGGNMTVARTGHTATLLPSGKVLIAGGGNAGLYMGAGEVISPQAVPYPPLESAELFDPQTGVFVPTGNMTTGRVAHSASLLADGTVLLCGGFQSYTNTYASTNTAEIYDPARGSFAPAGTMNSGRFWHTATRLPDGSIVLIGGVGPVVYNGGGSGGGALNSAEIFK